MPDSSLSQIYPHWNWNSKLNTKLRLEFQVEYGFKLEFRVEWLIRWESVSSYLKKIRKYYNSFIWTKISSLWKNKRKIFLFFLCWLYNLLITVPQSNQSVGSHWWDNYWWQSTLFNTTETPASPWCGYSWWGEGWEAEVLHQWCGFPVIHSRYSSLLHTQKKRVTKQYP